MPPTWISWTSPICPCLARNLHVSVHRSLKAHNCMHIESSLQPLAPPTDCTLTENVISLPSHLKPVSSSSRILYPGERSETVTLSKVTPQPLSGAPRLSVCVLDGLSRAPGSAHPVVTPTGILARCSGCSLGLTCPWSVGRAVCGVVGSILSPPRSPHLLNDHGSGPDSQPVVSLL